MRHTVTNAERGLDWRAQGNARVLQNIQNALRSWRGETPFLRSVGLNPALHHIPSVQAEAIAVAEVTRNIEEYVPEASVLEVRVSLAGCALHIEADVEVDED